MFFMFLILFLIIWSIFGCFIVWNLLINNKAYKQRIKIIDIVFKQVDWKHYNILMNEVSYGRHVNALVFFRNPLKLYDVELQELVEKNGGL